jgi:hypothetical protein
MKKKERKKYDLFPPKIAESNTVSLGHSLCGSCGPLYNKENIQKTLSACTHYDRSSNHTLVALKLSKPQMVIMLLEAPIIQHCMQQHVNLCLAEI